ncbi:MAG: V-type ATPase subunit [Clostridia bacterium]|nr:V-type ATPase subunit [Clostridia bacterium]
MAESLINSIARLRVIEKRLLTKETVSRLVQAASYEECLKILRESGYGAGAAAEGDETEALIAAQLGETYDLMKELMPERNAFVTDVFRMRHDMTNVKLFYKLRLIGEKADPGAPDFGGVYPADKLKAAVEKGDYSMLPKRICDALEELDVETYHSVDPQRISCRIDAAFHEYAMGLKNAFVREYFSALADFTNLIGAVRGLNRDDILPGGELGNDELDSIRAALKESPEKIPSMIKSPLQTSAVREAMKLGFAEYLRTGHAAALEKARDDYLISLASRGKNEISTEAPIVGYMLAREREAEVVRLILTAKRSGIPMSAIDERSLTLYG